MAANYSEPLLTIVIILGLVGLLRLRRQRGWWPVWLAFWGLLLISWPPADWLFSRPLERWYPVRPYAGGPVDAIVVLASSVHPPMFERPFPIADSETYERCKFAAWLQHRLQSPVLACGGRPVSRQQPYSVTMRQLLQQEGVPPELIWTEEQSRSTHENAVYGAAVLNQHGARRIALVVDAASMPRAAASFRKQGITVVPAPSSIRQFGLLFEEALPNWRAIQRNENVLHEMLALAWYRARGWI